MIQLIAPLQGLRISGPAMFAIFVDRQGRKDQGAWQMPSSNPELKPAMATSVPQQGVSHGLLQLTRASHSLQPSTSVAPIWVPIAFWFIVRWNMLPQWNVKTDVCYASTSSSWSVHLLLSQIMPFWPHPMPVFQTIDAEWYFYIQRSVWSNESNHSHNSVYGSGFAVWHRITKTTTWYSKVLHSQVHALPGCRAHRQSWAAPPSPSPPSAHPPPSPAARCRRSQHHGAAPAAPASVPAASWGGWQTATGWEMQGFKLNVVNFLQTTWVA